MKEAQFFLAVRFSVAAEAQAEVLRWLDGGHVAEVLRQPGFLWSKRIRLDAGGFLMLYGIESRAAFEAYEANAALKAKFAKERAPFEKHMRIERFSGDLEASHAG